MSLTDWLHGPPPGAGGLQVREVAGELRRLSVALLRAEAEALDGTELDVLLGHVRQACDDLARLPSIPQDATPAGPIQAPKGLTERSPVSGNANVVAAPLVLEHLEAMTRGTATFSELHEGPSGHVHGGVISAAFDELLGVAQIHSGAHGYTAELTVRFHRLTPLFEPIVHEARVLDRQGRRIRVEATSFRASDPDTTLASAVGIFIAQAHLPSEDEIPGP